MLTTGLIAIHPYTLVPNHYIGTNVYVWSEQKATAEKFLNIDQLVSESTFSYFLTNPTVKVFVEEIGYPVYQSYVNEHLNQWLTDPGVARLQKTALLVEYMHWQLSEAFSNPTIRKIIQSCNHCSDQLAQYGPAINISGRELIRVLRHDGSFNSHAINCAFYSFLISNARGFSAESLSEISSGAMLHDIGKVDANLFDEARNAPSSGSLDWTERNAKTHPTEGFRRLCKDPLIKETQLLMCYQHHERLDGKGFPVGLLADEIHEASKICTVANRFDGLTSVRGRRQPLTKAAALRVLEGERNSVIDREAFRCLDQQLN
jgi:HD-GYP domain-containing protein (c-di-GMP phosphodiesterase class II)